MSPLLLYKANHLSIRSHLVLYSWQRPSGRNVLHILSYCYVCCSGTMLLFNLLSIFHFLYSSLHAPCTLTHTYTQIATPSPLATFCAHTGLSHGSDYIYAQIHTNTKNTHSNTYTLTTTTTNPNQNLPLCYLHLVTASCSLLVLKMVLKYIYITYINGGDFKGCQRCIVFILHQSYGFMVQIYYTSVN